MQRLGLGQRIGGGGRRPILPAFVSNPAISATPRLDVLTEVGEFTYTGTEPVTPTYQWKRAGAEIIGATSSTFTETVAATGYGKLLARVIRLTNSAGFVEYESIAPGPTGKTLSETWASYANGDAWAVLDVLFERRSSASSANIITDTAAPSGKSAEVTIARTPGSFAAFEVSSFLIFACACGLRSIAAKSIP